MSASWEPYNQDPRPAYRHHVGQRKRWTDGITVFLRTEHIMHNSDDDDGNDCNQWRRFAANLQQLEALEEKFVADRASFIHV